MDEADDRYLRVLDEGPKFSTFAVGLPEEAGPPALSAVREALLRHLSPGSRVEAFPVTRASMEWCLAVEAVQEGAASRPFLVGPERSGADGTLAAFSPAVGEARPKMSRFCLALEAPLVGDPCAALEWVCEIARALVPDTPWFTDRAAYRGHPGDWVRGIVGRKIRPRLTDLYTIHAVKGDGTETWLHTHGLLRLGFPELEVLDAQNKENAGEALNAAVAMFSEHGVPPPDEPFPLGPEVDALWLPWERALRRAGPRGPGGADDREAPHDVPAMVLYAPRRKWFGLFGSGIGPLDAQPGLRVGSPILFRSTAETVRMAEAARAQLPALREAIRILGLGPDVKLLVKLGIPVDPDIATDAGPSDDREHMWFEVHTLDESQVRATLLNEPLGVKALSKGDVGTFPLASLTDWKLASPQGIYGPDDIGLLVATLASAPPTV